MTCWWRERLEVKMTKLEFDVPEEIAQLARVNAEKAGLSLPVYLARLIERDLAKRPLTMGLFEGKVSISDDFNEPLPDSYWLEGKL